MAFFKIKDEEFAKMENDELITPTKLARAKFVTIYQAERFQLTSIREKAELQ